MINEGESWLQEEDDYLKSQRGIKQWEKISNALGREIDSCKARLKKITASVDMSAVWSSNYRQGMRDYPRCSPPSKTKLHDFCAYMAGYNDKDRGY